jgi:hypothetical protein
VVGMAVADSARSAPELPRSPRPLVSSDRGRDVRLPHEHARRGDLDRLRRLVRRRDRRVRRLRPQPLAASCRRPLINRGKVPWCARLGRRLKMRGVGVRRAAPPLLAGTLSPAGERSRRAETMSGPGARRRREVTLRQSDLPSASQGTPAEPVVDSSCASVFAIAAGRMLPAI